MTRKGIEPQGSTHCRPSSLAGGGSGQIKGGRVIHYPEVPLANLLLTIVDKAGIPAETLGDSTGRLELSTLSGV